MLSTPSQLGSDQTPAQQLHSAHRLWQPHLPRTCLRTWCQQGVPLYIQETISTRTAQHTVDCSQSSTGGESPQQDHAYRDVWQVVCIMHSVCKCLLHLHRRRIEHYWASLLDPTLTSRAMLTTASIHDRVLPSHREQTFFRMGTWCDEGGMSPKRSRCATHCGHGPLPGSSSMCTPAETLI